MAKTHFSRHMIEDRTDRYITIATKVGFGTVLYTKTYDEQQAQYHNRTIELTSTGVCIVRGQDKAIITLYCATLAVIKSIFQLQKLPAQLFAAVSTNQRKGYCNIQLQFPNVVVGQTTKKSIDFFRGICYNIYTRKEKGEKKNELLVCFNWLFNRLFNW